MGLAESLRKAYKKECCLHSHLTGDAFPVEVEPRSGTVRADHRRTLERLARKKKKQSKQEVRRVEAIAIREKETGELRRWMEGDKGVSMGVHKKREIPIDQSNFRHRFSSDYKSWRKICLWASRDEVEIDDAVKMGGKEIR
uniref:Uncharacterized protein n=1 Tax=Chromera velia CCMP2878 TaxID=1169474 RepID=A0A0G4HAX2_9ALVE|eukprot:Cvel_25816.t1-p1 / transcript=Cvel_25816.t1 / gene=Cvel_25816 / organism=Chromera_velia_CCMP2878 / gene_product=hypothetical protein / transcript_product=hypothetical protein / location=Cvel_scaffold2977:476-895(-) / protein_length=140 / sequence_SO=supercontig / SO=protein_coding / is_pseudo=false